MTTNANDTDSIAINEVKFILAEKRTSLAVMRTGIAVLALPLSVLSLLIATSRYYDVIRVLYFIVPVILVSLVLIVFGGHLIIRSIMQMRRYDHLIQHIKLKHSVIGELLE